MDREGYIQAARAVRDANNPRAVAKAQKSVWTLSPFGGGRRILKVIAAAVRRTETELRAIPLPPDDQASLERHFLQPWSELAAFLEDLVQSTRARWLTPSAAFRLLENGPPDRPEDIEFCVTYGLDDHTPEDGNGYSTRRGVPTWPPGQLGDGQV